MELHRCINFLLTTAQHNVFQQMSAGLSEFDITPVQYAVLYCLWEEDIHNPKEIAKYLQVENSTISGVLDRMEKKNLIERKISKADRRCIQIDLTDKGKMLRDSVLKRVEEVDSAVMKIFSPEENRKLKDDLTLLTDCC